MPEYSSTTITPADSVKVPAMNGSTSGNFQLDALRNFILASKGQANGLASLDANGKLPAAQLPDLADDVLVYANYATFPASGTAGKLYIAADTNKIYRWDDSLGTPAYVYLKVDWTDLTDGTVTVKKAECDASGNTITSTYETKADANDLKNALQATNKRVTNLEQKAGDELIIDYPHLTYGMDEVPPNVAEYAKVTKLRGVSRVENNLNSLDQTYYDKDNGTLSFSDGVMTYVANNNTSDKSVTYTRTARKKILGHVYLFSLIYKSTQNFSYQNVKTGSIPSSSGYTQFSVVRELISSDSGLVNSNDYFYNYNGVSDWTLEVKGSILTDLNQYFGTSDLSFLGATDSAKLATIQTYYPWLLEPSEYGSSLVSTVYEGVKAIGANRWDGLFEHNTYWNANGAKVSTPNYDCCKNPIPVMPSTTYFYFADSSGSYANDIYYYWLDINGNPTSSSPYNIPNGSSFTSPANASYLVFYTHFQSHFGANPKIIIGLNSLTDKSYRPHMTDTLSLPTPITLRSAGSVAEEFDLETGEKTNPLANIDLANIAWDYVSGNERWKSHAPIGDAKEPHATSDAFNAIHATYEVMSIVKQNTNTTIQGICMYGKFLYCRNGSNSIKPSGTLWYELATPDPDTELTPVLDPFIEVEGGGTIRPIQSQATEIDSSMTAEYLSLGA